MKAEVQAAEIEEVKNDEEERKGDDSYNYLLQDTIYEDDDNTHKTR